MAEVVVNGMRIAYRRCGSGAPLLLFHGAFEDSRIWSVGLRSPTVAGLSLGSIFALLFARDHPTVIGGLVLVGAYAGWGGSLDADALAQRISSAQFTITHPVEDWADDFLDSVFAPGAPADRRAKARRLLDDWRPSTTTALLEVLIRDLRPDLPAIPTPTVVVRGTADARSPRSASLEICDLLASARLVEIAGAGHDCTGPELDAVLIAAARDAATRAAS